MQKKYKTTTIKTFLARLLDKDWKYGTIQFMAAIENEFFGNAKQKELFISRKNFGDFFKRSAG